MGATALPPGDPTDDGRAAWRTTTHDWSRSVDLEHLADLQHRGHELTGGSVLHLVLEVLAFAADEAQVHGGGRARVLLAPDGSLVVSDDGRGTDTRVDGRGHVVRKPVMSTRDVRFADAVDAPLLPDGHPRRGISLVAALSPWLWHVNRRADGAWRQRYEGGVSVTDLLDVETDGTTGTTVHFRPAPDLVALPTPLPPGVLDALTRWESLDVEVVDERGR